MLPRLGQQFRFPAFDGVEILTMVAGVLVVVVVALLF